MDATAEAPDATQETPEDQAQQNEQAQQRAEEEARQERESFNRRLGDIDNEYKKYGDPVEVLGIDPDADSKTIKSRYKELAFMYHPDTGGETADPEAFKG